MVSTPVPTGTSRSFPAKSTGTGAKASSTHLSASSLSRPQTRLSMILPRSVERVMIPSYTLAMSPSAL